MRIRYFYSGSVQQNMEMLRLHILGKYIYKIAVLNTSSNTAIQFGQAVRPRTS